VLKLSQPKRALTVVALSCSSIFCQSRGLPEECHYGNGPWQPAAEQEPCDAPPDVVVNATDSSCEVYWCRNGSWVPSDAPHFCQTFVSLPTSEVQCSPRCLADLDPSNASLDALCSFIYDPLDAPSTAPAPPPCIVSGNSYEPPGDSESCVAILVDEGEDVVPVPFPSDCRDAGVNGAFALFGVIPEGQALLVQCQWALEPEPPCPGPPLPLPEPPRDSCAK